MQRAQKRGRRKSRGRLAQLRERVRERGPEPIFSTDAADVSGRRRAEQNLRNGFRGSSPSRDSPSAAASTAVAREGFRPCHRDSRYDEWDKLRRKVGKIAFRSAERRRERERATASGRGWVKLCAHLKACFATHRWAPPNAVRADLAWTTRYPNSHFSRPSRATVDRRQHHLRRRAPACTSPDATRCRAEQRGYAVLPKTGGSRERENGAVHISSANAPRAGKSESLTRTSPRRAGRLPRCFASGRTPGRWRASASRHRRLGVAQAKRRHRARGSQCAKHDTAAMLFTCQWRHFQMGRSAFEAALPTRAVPRNAVRRVSYTVKCSAGVFRLFDSRTAVTAQV